MQTFKKVVFSTAVFILTVSLVSAILILPWANSNGYYYLDADYRTQHSGSFDCLISGSSHGLTGFVPSVIDKNLNCNSYNLSGTLMTMKARTFLLKKELERNPVKTVVIEVSYNALTRMGNFEHSEGDFVALARLDTFKEKSSFVFQNLTLNDCLDVYSRALFTGVLHLGAVVLNKAPNAADFSKKGHLERDINDVSLRSDEIASLYNSDSIVEECVQSNIDELKKQLSFCRDKNCRVIIAVTPLADSKIWKTKNFNSFYKWIKTFCQEQNCEFYDFNLLKDRYSLFFDDQSFSDDVHLNANGATVFSTVFVQTINRVTAGKDISNLFYGDYNELKTHSPYMKYYQTK